MDAVRFAYDLRWPETTYRLDDEMVSDVVDDVTPDKGAALEWLAERG